MEQRQRLVSGYLARVHFPFAHAMPKQQLTIRELQKLALNAFLVMKHCCNYIPPAKLIGHSLSQICHTLLQWEGSLSDFMLGLGRTFHFLMPTQESIQHSPLVQTHSMLSNDDQDKENHCSNLMQREASEICARVKRSKLQSFRDDPLLNRIRLDSTLNHQPVLVKGSGHRCMLCSSGPKPT